jgi:ATP-dependent Zn protease
MRYKSTERVAFHEAGHAVVAFHLKRKFRRVTIAPAGRSLGHTRFFPLDNFHPDYQNSARTRRLMDSEIMIDLAGLEAEYLKMGRRSLKGGQSDIDQAADLAWHAQGGGRAVSRYFRQLQVASRNLLREHWSEVESLATALLEQITLTEDEARKVITAGKA